MFLVEIWPHTYYLFIPNQLYNPTGTLHDFREYELITSSSNQPDLWTKYIKNCPQKTAISIENWPNPYNPPLSCQNYFSPSINSYNDIKVPWWRVLITRLRVTLHLCFLLSDKTQLFSFWLYHLCEFLFTMLMTVSPVSKRFSSDQIWNPCFHIKFLIKT